MREMAVTRKRTQPKASETPPAPASQLTTAARQDLLQTFDRAICLEVRLGYMSDFRRLPIHHIELKGVGKGSDVIRRVRARKRILTSESYWRVIQSADAIKEYLRHQAMPSPFQHGWYMIPIERVTAVDQKLATLGAERTGAIEEFIGDVERIKRLDKEALGPLFEERDYPQSAEEIRARFYTRITYFDLGIPGRLKRLDQRLFAREQAKLEALQVEAAQWWRLTLRVLARDLVKHLSERLAGTTTSGKTLILRRSAVTHIEEFITEFGPKNITNDTELSGWVDRLKRLVAGIDVTELRSDEGARTALGTQLAKVTTALDSLVEAIPVRRFRALGLEPAAVPEKGTDVR